MKKFYLIIGKDRFCVYHKDNNAFALEYIDGDPYMTYDIHRINGDIKRLLEALQQNYNLETMSELNFIVVKNSDPIRNSVIEKAITGEEGQASLIKGKYELKDILVKAIKKLSKDEKLHISEFGINYDGDSYILEDGILKQGEYNLLGYTIAQECLIDYCL